MNLASRIGILLFVLSQIGPALAADKPVLKIYTYDSFVAEGGLGPSIFPLFEKKCGCQLKVMPSGDGAQLVTRLQLDAERGHPEAQIVLGLDGPTFERARPYIESWGRWLPRGYHDLDPVITKTDGFLPYDYGFFGFMADHQALQQDKLAAPTKFADILGPGWRRNLILEDPRTSTPGLAFLLYAQTVSKLPAGQLWSELKSQWLTLSVSWDSAYGLFLRKEAPLVWSYTTSQAYHEEHGDNPAHRRYEALIFDEGLPMQIEGAALVKGAFDSTPQGTAARNEARQFLEFLLTPEVQALVPRRNWMYPARKGMALPDSFRHVPRPKAVVQLPEKASDVDADVAAWSKAVSR